MIIDTHAHYDDEKFNEDREELLKSMKDKGVGIIVNASATVESCQISMDMARKYNFMYTMTGVHPTEVEPLEKPGVFEKIKELVRDEKCVAIGEIGLDYHWDEPDREIQKKWFKKQLELAEEIGKPVNIHSRDAAEDTLNILKEYRKKDNRGIIHCYSYGKDLAREFLNMGFSIGVGGVVTFKNSKKLKEVVEYVPLDRIVLETDCPYLAPEPYRGSRNDSALIHYVAETIAGIKNISKEQVIEETERNARRIYKIKEI